MAHYAVHVRALRHQRPSFRVTPHSEYRILRDGVQVGRAVHEYDATGMWSRINGTCAAQAHARELGETLELAEIQIVDEN